MPDNAPVLSLIIVTYNPGDIVLDCLHSVLAATAEIRGEIIVVDNQSQDGTPARIVEQFPQVNVIINPDNRGFAAANNIGVNAAGGEYLLLLNPDVVVQPATFKNMLAYMADHAQAGIAGPRTMDDQGKIALSAYPPLTALMILWHYLGFSRLLPDVLFGHYRRQCQTATEPFTVGWVQGHALLIRRAVWQAIGGLDDHLFLFAEEPDYCDRAAKAGWKTVYLPQAQLTHYESTTVSRYSYIKMLHLHISILYYFRKRGQRGAVWLLKTGFLLELGVKWLIRFVQTRMKREASLTGKLNAYPSVMKAVVRY